MSDSFHPPAKASATPETTPLPHQLSTRPFVVEPLKSAQAGAIAETRHSLDAGVLRTLGIQAKLAIGEGDDPYEQEADQIAAQVVEHINTPQAQSKRLQRQAVPEEEEELMMKPLVQRQEMPEEEDEELMMKPLVQRQAGDDLASPELETAIESARGQGHPLAEEVRVPMEQAFGTDFSGVRVHTDAQSDQLNQSIQAKAFTTGQDIFFRQGAYQPAHRSGQELIAHELTHVIQQQSDRLTKSPLQPISCPSLEIDAGVLQRQDEQQKQVAEVFGNITNMTDFGKSLSDFDPNNPSGFGTGIDTVNEFLKRGASGEGTGQAIGGGLTKGLTSGLWNAVSERQWGPSKPSVTGLLGSGLKMIGGFAGEQPSSEFGLTDAGEALDFASKLSPSGLAGQGVEAGWMGLYDTLHSGADYLATGSTDAFLQQGEKQLKSGNPVMQGYSMLANLAGSVAIGDYSEMYRIGDMADQGELSFLPKLGSKIGDTAYDISEVAGAGLGMIGDLVTGDWENIENRQEMLAMTGNPIGEAVVGASNFLSEQMTNTTDYWSGVLSGDTSLIGDLKDIGSFAADSISDTASDAWGWTKDKLSFW